MPLATAPLAPRNPFHPPPVPLLSLAPVTLSSIDQRPPLPRNQTSTNAHAFAPLSRSKQGQRLMGFGSACAGVYRLAAALFLPASPSVLVKRSFGFSWAGFASLIAPVSFCWVRVSASPSPAHCSPFPGKATRVPVLRWAGSGVLRMVGQIVLVKSFSSPCISVSALASARPPRGGLNHWGVCRA